MKRPKPSAARYGHAGLVGEAAEVEVEEERSWRRRSILVQERARQNSPKL